MNKLLKSISIGLATLSLVACMGNPVAKEYENASVVTDPVEQQQIIEQVFAVSFADLANVDMNVDAKATFLKIINLEISGEYKTEKWGTENAHTKINLDVKRPLKIDGFLDCSGNGKTINASVKELTIANQTILQATQGSTSSLIDTSNPEVMNISLLATLAGLDSEDVVEIKKTTSSDGTTYYIAADKETLKSLFASFGIEGISITSEPKLGFTMNNGTLTGISLNFEGDFSGLEMNFTLLAKAK